MSTSSSLPPNLKATRLPDGGLAISRETRESLVEVTVGFGQRDDTVRSDTGIDFFNHMLEMIAWYGGFNLRATYRTDRFRLTHVIWEDIGVVFGHAVRQILEQRIPDGIAGDGSGFGAIDDALAFSCVVLEGRANHFLDLPDSLLVGDVEDAHNTDLAQFFEGFAQGCRATVHLRLIAGRDPHHRWEACFRAFAKALRAALAPDPWRAGATAGVKGTLD